MLGPIRRRRLFVSRNTRKCSADKLSGCNCVEAVQSLTEKQKEKCVYNMKDIWKTSSESTWSSMRAAAQGIAVECLLHPLRSFPYARSLSMVLERLASWWIGASNYKENSDAVNITCCNSAASTSDNGRSHAMNVSSLLVTPIVCNSQQLASTVVSKERGVDDYNSSSTIYNGKLVETRSDVVLNRYPKLSCNTSVLNNSSGYTSTEILSWDKLVSFSVDIFTSRIDTSAKVSQEYFGAPYSKAFGRVLAKASSSSLFRPHSQSLIRSSHDKIRNDYGLDDVHYSSHLYRHRGRHYGSMWGTTCFSQPQEDLCRNISNAVNQERQLIVRSQIADEKSIFGIGIYESKKRRAMLKSDSFLGLPYTTVETSKSLVQLTGPEELQQIIKQSVEKRPPTIVSKSKGFTYINEPFLRSNFSSHISLESLKEFCLHGIQKLEESSSKFFDGGFDQQSCEFLRQSEDSSVSFCERSSDFTPPNMTNFTATSSRLLLCPTQETSSICFTDNKALQSNCCSTVFSTISLQIDCNIVNLSSDQPCRNNNMRKNGNVNINDEYNRSDSNGSYYPGTSSVQTNDSSATSTLNTCENIRSAINNNYSRMTSSTHNGQINVMDGFLKQNTMCEYSDASTSVPCTSLVLNSASTVSISLLPNASSINTISSLILPRTISGTMTSTILCNSDVSNQISVSSSSIMGSSSSSSFTDTSLSPKFSKFSVSACPLTSLSTTLATSSPSSSLFSGSSPSNWSRTSVSPVLPKSLELFVSSSMSTRVSALTSSCYLSSSSDAFTFSSLSANLSDTLSIRSPSILSIRSSVNSSDISSASSSMNSSVSSSMNSSANSSMNSSTSVSFNLSASSSMNSSISVSGNSFSEVSLSTSISSSLEISHSRSSLNADVSLSDHGSTSFLQCTMFSSISTNITSFTSYSVTSNSGVSTVFESSSKSSLFNSYSSSHSLSTSSASLSFDENKNEIPWFLRNKDKPCIVDFDTDGNMADNTEDGDEQDDEDIDVTEAVDNINKQSSTILSSTCSNSINSGSLKNSSNLFQNSPFSFSFFSNELSTPITEGTPFIFGANENRSSSNENKMTTNGNLSECSGVRSVFGGSSTSFAFSDNPFAFSAFNSSFFQVPTTQSMTTNFFSMYGSCSSSVNSTFQSSNSFFSRSSSDLFHFSNSSFNTSSLGSISTMPFALSSSSPFSSSNTSVFTSFVPTSCSSIFDHSSTVSLFSQFSDSPSSFTSQSLFSSPFGHSSLSCEPSFSNTQSSTLLNAYSTSIFLSGNEFAFPNSSSFTSNISEEHFSRRKSNFNPPDNLIHKRFGRNSDVNAMHSEHLLQQLSESKPPSDSNSDQMSSGSGNSKRQKLKVRRAP